MKLRLAFIVMILSVAAVSGFTVVIGDSNGGNQYEPIDSADSNPNVTSNDTTRLLASNDIDQTDGTAKHPDVYNVSARDMQMRSVGPNSSQPIMRIDKTAFTVEQARQYALLTDGYREQLYTEVQIPTNDTWQNGSQVTVQDTLFVGFEGNETVPEESGPEKVVYVEIKGQKGQVPARNVEVLAEDTPDGQPPGDLYIANPNEMQVYDGEMKSYSEMNQESVEQSYVDTPINASAVPSTGEGNQTTRYEVQHANITGRWHNETEAIQDHYIGVARISKGALYGEYWIVDPEQISVTTLYDFRATVPYTKDDPYTEEGPKCEYDCNENGTDCKTAVSERYEYYENPRVDNETTRLYHNGTWYDEDTGEWWESDGGYGSTGQPFVVPINDPASGVLSPYSSVTVKYDHTYGVDYPSECEKYYGLVSGDWEKTKTNKTTSTISKDAEHQIRPANINNISITVYVKDQPDSQEMYIDIVGDQRPEKNPIGAIRVTSVEDTAVERGAHELADAFFETAPDDVWVVHSPWITYPQTMYGKAEIRQQNRSTWNETYVNGTGGATPVYRDYMGADAYKTSNRGTIMVAAQGMDPVQTYEGVAVGSQVQNDRQDITLYRTYGGTVLSTNTGTDIEAIQASATSIFGDPIEVDTKYVEYDNTILTLTEQPNGEVAKGKLMTTTGDPVPYREVKIQGGQTNNTTTNSTGEFMVQIDQNATRVSATFEGDKLRENKSQHYNPSSDSTSTVGAQLNVIATPLSYLSDFISNLWVVIHWIVLGLFFVWWTKFRNSN